MKRSGKTRDASLASVLQTAFAEDFKMLTRLARKTSRIPSAADVHKARIALRRSAALLRFFASDLKTRGALPLAGRLRSLARTLGEARDATVWRKLLESKKVRHAAEDAGGWKNYLATERRREIAAYAKLAGVWSRSVWVGGLSDFEKFLRVELPHADSQADAACAAQAFLKRQFARLPARSDRLPESAAKLHKLRRKMRRVRYAAGAFENFLKRNPRRHARALHEIESKLGRLHDIDVALVRLAKDSREPASRLAAVLAHRRSRFHTKFSKVWK